MTANHRLSRAMTRRHNRLLLSILACGGLLWTGCSDQPTDPDTSLTTRLAMAAIFPEGAASQASFVDAWRVQVSRPGEGVIAQDSGVVDPEDQTISVQVTVTLEASCETLSIRVELSAGGQVWFQSERNHQVCSGSGNQLQTQQLQFVRPQPSLGPTTIPFVVQEGLASSGTFRITYEGTDGLDWMAWVQEGDVTWLSLQPSSGSVTAGQPQDVSVSVNTIGLAPARYTAHLVVVGEGFTDPIGQILVDLTVTQGPRIGLSTTSLSFVTDEGASPPQQQFLVTNLGGGTLDWNASDNVGWLSLSPTSGSLGPSQSQLVTVTVTGGALNPGGYLAAITVSDPGAANSPLILPADLTVRELPEIQLSATNLIYSALEGTSPIGQLFTVSNSGGGVLNWQASDDVGWLSLVPRSGVLGKGLAQWITASVNSDDLEPGNYSATITVTDEESSNSPQTVFVSLTVVPRTAPTLSDPTWTLRVLNDTTCGNSGSRYDISFLYADPDGDVPVKDGFFDGTPVRLEWHFLPDGFSGQALITTATDGNGFSGKATFDVCIAFQFEGNTSVRETLFLRDEWNLWSNSLAIVIPRPKGGNAPPPGSVARTEGVIPGRRVPGQGG